MTVRKMHPNISFQVNHYNEIKPKAIHRREALSWNEEQMNRPGYSAPGSSTGKTA